MECVVMRVSLSQSRRGGIALMAAVAAVPLMLAAGAAIDLGRVYFVHRGLQGVVDAAALAGVSVFRDTSAADRLYAEQTAADYFARNAAALTGLEIGAPSIAASATGSCAGGDAVATVTVSAGARVTSSLMGLVNPGTDVTASATAQNPLMQFSLDLGDFNPGRMDADKLTLYWYKVPEDGGVPAAAALVTVADNVDWEPSQVYSQCVSASDRIGIALATSPGYRHAGHYINPTNPYGGALFGNYVYYSHLYPPTADAYAEPNNCALQIGEGLADAPPQSGRCFTPYESRPFAALAGDGTFRCRELEGRIVTYFWNDMGPGWDQINDDLDYDDLILSFTCSTEGTPGAILTR